MSNNSNLSSPDKSVKGDGNSYLDHSTTNTDARDMSTHNSVVNNSSTSSNVDNSHHIHLNVQGGDLAALGLAPQPVKEIKEMTDADRERLDRAVNQILNNRENIYESSLPKLKALATEFPDSDKAQYYYHLLLASGSAQNYITHYKNVSVKTYWLSFWAYTAFKRVGRSNEAESVLSQLSKWQEQYTDNSRVIEAYGLVYDCLKRNGGSFLMQDAADVINNIARCSDYLQPLLHLIANTIGNGGFEKTGNSGQDFYLKIFDFDLNKVQVKPQRLEVPVITEPVVQEPEPPRYNPPKPTYIKPTSNPTPTPPTTTTISSNHDEKKSSVGKYIKGAVVLAIVVFGYKTCFSSSDEPKEEKNEAQVETVVSNETPATTGKVAEEQPKRSTSQSSSGNVKAKQTRQQSESQSSREPERVEKPANTPASQPMPEPKTHVASTSASASASTSVSESASTSVSSESIAELVSAGKSAVRSFNYSSAVKYFTEAASKGSSEANLQLGLLYSNSNFDGHNTNHAISFMKKAALSGSVEAMYQLGMLYSGRDNESAKLWLSKAAANGHAKAKSTLNRFTN